MALARRSLLTLTALAGAATVAGCAKKSTDATAPQGSASGSSGGANLTVFLSGDTNMQELWEKALIPAFVKANPGYSVKVQLDLHGEHDAQTKAKLTAAQSQGKDSGLDLIDAGFVTGLAEAGIMEPISTSNVPNLDGVPADVVTAGKGGGIPYRGSSVLLAYDPAKVTKVPTTLDEVLAWIKANPGQFTYCPPKSGGSGGAWVTTVLDKYLDPTAAEKLRTTYDQEAMKGWSKGFAELKGLGPSIYQKGVYPNGNSQVLELLASGQISMCTVWSDQFISGQKTGLVPDKIKATQISNPSFTGGAAYLGVPKASAKKEHALKLANFVLSSDAQVLIANQIAGFPVIPLEKLPDETQKIFKEAHPDVLRPGYLDKVGNDMSAQWDQLVPGK
ncbi:extracellular solute-binding protein [Aestuariimicrobium kwangyangense]|uniref:extracellular solute-binding protein n=1 Tax=Aestuariimicrobium kwangyangense TaxID=396389 RepID=UPI0003B47D5E|nr:extracellular solute-binding protein [Aestuariimicrobium kwangyangense]